MRKLKKTELKRVYGGTHGHGDNKGGDETAATYVYVSKYVSDGITGGS